ncbi:MAG: ATP-binding protein [Thiomicrospira sp.]|jgi:PAS domain S-box-containing protein|nr:ATP-binding protein [Thiomicrospira sp.]
MTSPQPNTDAPKIKLGMIFIGLSFGIIALVFTYFYAVLDPKLREEAQTQATMLTQSLSHGLKFQTVLQDAFLLQKEIGKILLYNDERYNRPFVSGLVLEFNPALFPQHSRSLQRGELDCEQCFKVVTPLYDQQTLQLLGQITFYVDAHNYLTLVNEITKKFFLTLTILAVLLLVIWMVIRRLWQQNLSAQQQMQASNAYNQHILNTMQDMLFLVDNKGQILDANRFALEQIKTSLDEIKHHFIQQYLHLTDSKARLLTLIKQPQPQQIEVRVELSPNHSHLGLVSASPFNQNAEDSEQTSYLLVVKDIQALKTAEARLAYQAQMAHAGRLKSLGEMATGIAHEINQPLTVIRLGAEGIKFSLSAQQPEAFEVEVAQDIIDQVDRVSRIINNMRAFARFQPAPKSWIKLHLPIESALSFFKEQLRINGIQVIEQLDLDCPEVLIESQKFEQVMVNLIGNARHALNAVNDDRVKKISITMTCTPEAITLVVADNGIGMDDNTLEHCLDPFFTTKDSGEGTGLGLSIVHTIVQEFNIKLMIQSELNQGSSFTLTIPHRFSEIPE